MPMACRDGNQLRAIVVGLPSCFSAQFFCLRWHTLEILPVGNDSVRTTLHNIRLVGAESVRRVDGKLQVESFKTHEETIERIREIRASFCIQPERAYDPENANSDENGYVWVIAVTLHKDAETLYLCTDGCIR